jgi:hypothetical protein
MVSLTFELFSLSFFPSLLVGGVTLVAYLFTTDFQTSNPFSYKKGLNPFISKCIFLSIKTWCSNLSVFHDLLPVVKLLFEGPSLIPIVGILMGGESV